MVMESSKTVVRGKTPEEQMDWQSLSGGYLYFLWVIVFLTGGVTLFVGIMSQQVCAVVAVLIASFGVPLVLGPTIWDVDTSSRLVRRIRKQAFFPIRTKQFFLSKVKIGLACIGMFWLISLGLQLMASPLFGFRNILIYQGILLVSGVVNLLFYSVLSVAGARIKE